MVGGRSRPWSQNAILAATLFSCFPAVSLGQVEGTQPLDTRDDLAMTMVAGIGRDLDKRIEQAARTREASHAAFMALEGTARAHATKTKLDKLAKILGTTDIRVQPSGFEAVSSPWATGPLASTAKMNAHAVRFEALPGVHGEGILLEPAGTALASVVVLPDAAHTPEQHAGLTPGLMPQARLGAVLASRGCRVICLSLLDRENQFSSNPSIQRFTNIPHREFLYRGAYEMGRTPTGYEVVKAQAAIDNLLAKAPRLPVALVGHGEGGRIALYAGALDSRVSGTLVCGVFGPRESMWKDPIDRNLWGILLEHGDAQVADLFGDRGLVIESAEAPSWAGPTPNAKGSQAAPGMAETVSLEATKREFAGSVRSRKPNGNSDLVGSGEGPPGSADALARLAHHLKIKLPDSGTFPWEIKGPLPDRVARQKCQLEELLSHVDRLWRASHRYRDAAWAGVSRAGADSWQSFTADKRRFFSTEVIGELPKPQGMPNPRSRPWKNGKAWKGHEVTLDLGPDVFAYGILLIPNDIKPGERRPVVVCQHGLEGRPSDVCEPDKITPYYNSFGSALADRGYIVFAPQNCYIGKADFRLLQRKANPVKLSLFSYIVRQHERILDWLETLPMVDAKRIGFYGLSYGGKTAMRVPALVPRYALSICSGDFNEWVGKNILTDYPGSYVFTFEHEMPEFDLGHTFNYAEMAYLIAPRPFMVERGHDDGVGIDEMVSWEFARVRRQFTRWKIPANAEITYFSGGHEVRGGPCYDFLDRHLAFKPGKEAAR